MLRYTYLARLVSFHEISEIQKHKMLKLLSLKHHRAPRMDRWNIRGTLCSVTDLPVL